MSLFDPNTDLERLERDVTGGWLAGSGKPIPNVSDADARSAQIKLLRLGVEIVRSPNQESTWEDAYAVFAMAILKSGAVPTEELLHVDIPNMLFNHALVCGWFSNFSVINADGSSVLFLSPQRIPKENIGGRDGSECPDDTKEEHLRWYRDRIRPAVYEWTANAIEQRFKYEDFMVEVLEQAGREPPPTEAGLSDAETPPEDLPPSQPSIQGGEQSRAVTAKEKTSDRRWFQKQLGMRGWSTLELYAHGGPHYKTSNSYLKGKHITAKSLKKIVDALNLDIPSGGSWIDINILPD